MERERERERRVRKGNGRGWKKSCWLSSRRCEITGARKRRRTREGENGVGPFLARRSSLLDEGARPRAYTGWLRG